MFSRFGRQRGQSEKESWLAAERGRGEQGSGANRGGPVKCFKVRKRSLNLICKETRKEQDRKSLQMYFGWNEKRPKS